MRYILYSPPHDIVREEFTRTTTGEVVPRKVFHCGARALFYHKKFPTRRYRSDIPNIDNVLSLLKCKTIKQAKEEQAGLKAYCGEMFEIREYSNGQVGKRVADENMESKGGENHEDQ